MVLLGGHATSIKHVGLITNIFGFLSITFIIAGDNLPWHPSEE